MRYIQKRILLFSALIFSFSAFSQDGYTYVSQDLESWNSTAFKLKIHKKFGIGIEQGIRLNRNASSIDQVLTEFNFVFKPVDYLSFGSGFRYIADRGNNLLFDHDFRWNLDMAVSHKISALSLKYRLRYQNRNEIGYSTSEGDYFKHYLRLKASAEYKFKNWKFDPIFTAEIFRDMTRYSGGFDKMRFTLGTNYSFNKQHEFEFFYGLERTIGTSYPKSTYILGIGYTFTLKTKSYE